MTVRMDMSSSEVAAQSFEGEVNGAIVVEVTSHPQETKRIVVERDSPTEEVCVSVQSTEHFQSVNLIVLLFDKRRLS